ncbi:MAG: TIGR03790 family protein [Caldimonas sp.]
MRLTLARIDAVLRRLLWIAVLASGSAVAQRPLPGVDTLRMALPQVGLRARDIAVIVNDTDPASVEVGRYYAAQRGIAADRVVHVSFPAGQPVMRLGDFMRVQEVLEAQVDAGVQAFALAWTLPYRVECMSVTAAFALGFDPAAYCAEGCQTTRTSPYFNSPSAAPFTDHRLRPAMLLAGSDVESAKRLIDRGVRADERWPDGKAYLINTRDGSRNVRAEGYERVKAILGSAYPIEQVDADALEGRTDVMFQFTGVARVASLAGNRFADGAIADHLTSFGGALLPGGGQTTALEWLQAGATGSYGTSSEPCNYRAKFPEIGVVMARYLAGETLVEAYWKSVLMPGQGVFVGDPLTRPFGGVRVARSAAGTVISTRALLPGDYLLEAGTSPVGPFQPIRALRMVGFGVRQLTLPATDTRYFRLRPVPPPVRPASAPVSGSESSASAAR